MIPPQCMHATHSPTNAMKNAFIYASFSPPPPLLFLVLNKSPTHPPPACPKPQFRS